MHGLLTHGVSTARPLHILLSPFQGCTPPAAGIRKARVALPSDFGAQHWLPRAPQLKAQKPQRIASHLCPGHTGLAGIPGTWPQPADVPIPSVQTSQTPLCSRKTTQQHSKELRGGSAKPPLPCPTPALAGAGHGCANTARMCTKGIKGILLTFSYSSSKAGAHRLSAGAAQSAQAAAT